MVAPYTAPEAAAVEGAAQLRWAPFFPAPRSVARYDSHGAPRAPLNSPGEQPVHPRKQPETRVFHSVDKFFPLCGKTAKSFSIVWKNRPNIFHIECEKPHCKNGLHIGSAPSANRKTESANPYQRECRRFRYNPSCSGGYTDAWS